MILGGRSGGGGSRQPALVVGDSMVTVAARSTDTAPVRLVGYSGLTPGVYADATSPLISDDLAAAGRPRTVVLNWNGNNPGNLDGTQLVATYRTELTDQIRWYLRHGVRRIVLAAAVPSSFNSTSGQVDWTTPASRLHGWMLGSARLNDLYRELADEFPGRVHYSERAARAIHPAMAFNTELNGHRCIVDFVHPAPYCAQRYARALVSLAAGH
ncbi:hypothetical protein; putative Esterase/acetylhydrolase domains [Frankia alni ACN14a]|uniref:SGNH hydrolase-type esterase domain-containing protein n=1 Tax=Frankia alni (strain DSM 45986 / CECT 9034 / ACN14a) TaxID=326424 RepID=Q0RU95_FRAAA|nr:hypothetical protein; putative Esterase/acetylhydrolase domains [Frankia alni ACN14a]